jgi:hypothetical protein
MPTALSMIGALSQVETITGVAMVMLTVALGQAEETVIPSPLLLLVLSLRRKDPGVRGLGRTGSGRGKPSMLLWDHRSSRVRMRKIWTHHSRKQYDSNKLNQSYPRVSLEAHLGEEEQDRRRQRERRLKTARSSWRSTGSRGMHR